MDVPIQEIGVQTGLDDESLLKLKDNPLPTEISSKIQRLVDQLVENDSRRNDTLLKLIRQILFVSPTNRAEYMWYLKCIATVILLKGLPLATCVLQGNLLTNLFSKQTSQWDRSPIMINYFAQGIYDIFENDLNLIFVINQIGSRSPLGLYVSIVMLWKSIYRFIDEEKSKFIFYPPSNLIEITLKMNKVKLETNVDKFYQFFMVLSKLTNLLFHMKSRMVEHDCYKEYFDYDVQLIKCLRNFFEGVVYKVEEMFRRHKEIHVLTIIEYVQLEITEFDTLIQQLS